MRANALDYRASGREERENDRKERSTSLMTPARRAGLEALEREFTEFLRRPAR